MVQGHRQIVQCWARHIELVEAEGDCCDYVRHLRIAFLTHDAHVQCRTSTKVERIKDYLAVAEAPGLTSNDIEEIDSAGSQETRRHSVRSILFHDNTVLMSVTDDILAVGECDTVRTKLHDCKHGFLTRADASIWSWRDL